MSGRTLFKKNKIFITFFVKLFSIFPRWFRVFIWDSTTPYSQKIFIGIRYVILKSMIKSCGDNVQIGKNVAILHWKGVSIGHNVSIHNNCYLDGAGTILIGNNISIAHNTSIISSNHSWDDPDTPIKYNPILTGPVTINDDVWVGCGCRILSGITIESRCIIAAGAVLNIDCDSNSLYGGIPAKKIKKI